MIGCCGSAKLLDALVDLGQIRHTSVQYNFGLNMIVVLTSFQLTFEFGGHIWLQFQGILARDLVLGAHISM